MHHVDVEIVDRPRAGLRLRIECVARPLLVLPLQMKAPLKCPGVQIKCEQTVKSGRCQEKHPLHATDFVTMLEVAIPV